jgi:hypothetical protein
MMDGTRRMPNARYRVLELIKNAFHPGDRLVGTSISSGDVEAQGFVTGAGHRLLLANKRNHAVVIAVPDAAAASALVVDATTADGPARSVKLVNGKVELGPFAVAVVAW